MAYFLLRDYNILPKKELHWSLGVRTGSKFWTSSCVRSLCFFPACPLINMASLQQKTGKLGVSCDPCPKYLDHTYFGAECIYIGATSGCLEPQGYHSRLQDPSSNQAHSQEALLSTILTVANSGLAFRWEPRAGKPEPVCGRCLRRSPLSGPQTLYVP